MPNVTIFLILPEDLRNASSNTENLLLPVRLRQQVWWENREAEKFSVILGEASWSFTKVISSSKLNDKGKG